MSDIEMRILLSAIGGSDVISSIQSVGQALSSGSGLGGALLGVGAAAAGAAVAIGAASVQSAADFQTATTKIASYAGLSGNALDFMKQNLMDMSTQVGQSPTALANALYPVVSAGYQASDALNILKLSAETAAASGADTTVVADGLTTALKAFNFPAKDAGSVMDVLNQSVANAKTTFPELSAVIGKVSLSASAAHVPFVDMNAALDTLTTHGFPSVAQASTSLGNLFTQLGVKTDALQKHANDLHLKGFDAAKFSAMDLADKIDYLNKVTGGNQAEILKMLGGSTTALKAYNALSGGAKDYADNLDKLNNSQGKTEEVFKNATETYNFQSQQMGAAFEKVKIAIGSQLLPVVSQVMSHITPLITGFSDWVTKSHVVENSVQTLGVWINNLKNFLAPLGPLLGQVASWLGNTGNAILNNKNLWTTLWNALQGIWNFLSTTFTPAWRQLVNVFQTQMIPAWNDLMNTIKPILPELQKFGMVVGGVFLTLFSLITGIIAGIIGALGGFLSGMAIWFGGIVKAWTGLVQTISGVIAFIVDLVTGRFDKLGADLSIIWGGIVKMFQGVWDGIRGLFIAAINGIIGLVNGFVAGVLGPINTVLSAAHLATISVGQIPMIAAPASTAAPSIPGYQSPALSKSGIPNAPTDQATAFINAMQQQATQMQGQQATMQNAAQAQQQNMSQLLASPALSPSGADSVSNTIKATSAASDAKKAAAAAKKQDAADARSAKLATTLQNALDKSSSTQVQALVDQAKAAEAAGKTSMASLYAQQAAAQAAKDQAAAKKDQTAANKAAKAAALAQAKMDKFNQVAAGQGGAISPNSTIMTPFTSSSDNSIAPSGYPVSSTGSSAPTQQQTIFNITINGLVGDKSTIVDYIMQQISRQLRSSGVLYPTTSGGRAV